MSMFEINLVPDVKRQLLHAISVKRVILFFSALVVLIGVGVLVLLGAIMGWQEISSAQKSGEMNDLYAEFSRSPNINTTLTVQNQLKKLQEVYAGKKNVSRIFSVLDVVLPVGEYSVSLSSMTVNFDTNIIYIEGQAQSVNQNDYQALEAFVKTLDRTYYDFGRYYDRDGNVIPTVDITEVSENGSIYGIYHKPVDCDARPSGTTTNGSTGTATGSTGTDANGTETEPTTPSTEVCAETEDIKIKRYASEAEINKQNGYKFESQCGATESLTTAGAKVVQSSCKLSANGLRVNDRTSGRNASSNEIVLRFTGQMSLEDNIFLYGNKHMFIIGPSRQNVTDSYDQIRDMFEEKAKECAADDTDCMNQNTEGTK